MKKQREIFVVDDSHIIVNLITQSINQIDGYKATAFKSAEAMFGAVKVGVPELVVLDFFLDTELKGGMNGGRAASKLKTIFPNIKIILISGTSSPKAIAEIKSLEVDVHLHKDDDDILDKINEAITKILD